ncbi:MAG: hypothetical protein AB7M12_06480 [Hyphomonadaceae bacterium]
MDEGLGSFEGEEPGLPILHVGGAAAAMAFAAVLFVSPAFAQSTVPPDMVDAAKAGQASCVKRGEDARVCACGVGLAYAQLDPKVFKLIPQVEPLLDQKSGGAATGQLLMMAAGSGLSASDLISAYDIIKANRATVKQVCKPLAVK